MNRAQKSVSTRHSASLSFVMSLDHNNHPSVNPAATSNASTPATDGTKPASSGPSTNSTATVIVAVVVGLVLLTIIACIAITENRKKKAAEGSRARANEDKERALVGSGSRDSFGSFESELKEPEPAMKVFSRIAS